MSERETLAEPLLQELDLDVEGVHVVAIGGGSGLARVLRAVQHYTDVITAVVSVADDGGSSGRLSPSLGIPPPGDLRQALLALSDGPSIWRDVISYRFTAGDVAGHSLGNLILAALAELGEGLEEALERVGRMLGCRGAVVPAVDRPVELEAVIDGRVVVGQTAVSLARGSLSELRVVPGEIQANDRAVAALRGADQIVLGPGSLFTSVAACLLVPGIAEAVNGSAAQVVYVCNLVTQDGETLGMDAVDHVDALVNVAGIRLPDVVVAHRGPIRPQGNTEAVEVDGDRLQDLGCRVEISDLADAESEVPVHEPARLGAVLRRLA